MKKRAQILAAFCVVALGFGITSHANSNLSSDEILKKADEVRNPSESYAMRVSVLSGEDLQDRSEFDVMISSNQKTLVRTLSPMRDRGRNLLMLDEEMWAFVPNLNRAVRVSLNQKLSGQAANGDISRMRWSGDYDAKIEVDSPKEWTLFLTAKRKGLTYEKIRVWIEKQTFHPKKAEFLTLSGEVLKTAHYEDYRTIAGGVRPGKMRINDAHRTSDVSLIQIDSMNVKQFPASLFNQNSLR